ncbi:MAG: Rieske 2Fe-2S domain-containing protein [Polyangiales bacterium]
MKFVLNQFQVMPRNSNFVTRESNRLRAFPTGWFLVCFSDELAAGEVKSIKFMGQDLVVFRTDSGTACLSDAFCPHMGAHLGHGGTIEGETLRCPFHGFCFDTQGACVKTGYDTKPPRKARLRTWPLEEMNGLILAHHHQDWEAPAWRVPKLDDSGWTPLSHHTREIRANPYDTAENSVDFGHLSIVHGYRKTEIISPLSTDGPKLTASYAMDRNAGLFLKRSDLRAEFQITKWGLGYSCVEVEVPEFGLRSRHFVFPSAIDHEMLKLNVAVSLRHVAHPEKINPLLRLVPKPALHRMILAASMRGYKADVSQDFEIWEHKIGVERPPLAEGDGPIHAFREWTTQFDPGPKRDTSAVFSAAE